MANGEWRMANVGGARQTERVPELPEVQALVTDLGARLTGRTIDRLDVVSFAVMKTFDPPASALSGARIEGVSRHGKFLDIAVSRAGEPDLHLIMHLARAGWIRWRPGPPAAASGRPGKGPLAARLVLTGEQRLAGEQSFTTERSAGEQSLTGEPATARDADLVAGAGLDITEAGTKKSLAIYLVTDPAVVTGIARLGPDPLDDSFTLDVFAGILSRSGRAQIKGVLRNQGNIAGIGNAYSDEILHVARMSPFKPASMSEDEVARLYDAVQVTLRDAVARSDGLAASELKKEKKSGLRVHGKTGEACPVCGDTVREVIFADSTLQYCPTCQTGGKPLADRVLSRLLK